ncbi:hypothetical protein QJS10_CPA01g00956 [Acorus calamus]|uniref:Uncharacterized protein n=1 Tax=Acorus calamus TaxID=4465 RepID=A0AAV9FJK9_ACOCL|nr:hypothetical protein QJS10_CPA01g00956 [Acorus calamus]
MEDSTIHSSMNKALSTEESGWTKYFDDFRSLSQTENVSIFCTSGPGGSSLVSDAASCVAAASKTPATSKKLSKRRWRRGVVEEDPLEDTASSLFSSPKVGHDLNENPRKKDDNIEKTKVHDIRIEGTASGDSLEVNGDETEEMAFVGRTGPPCAEALRQNVTKAMNEGGGTVAGTAWPESLRGGDTHVGLIPLSSPS